MQVFEAGFVFEIVDRTVGDPVVAELLAPDEESRNPVVGRILQASDQRHGFVASVRRSAVDQHAQAVVSAHVLELDQVVEDDHADAQREQQHERSQAVEQKCHRIGRLRQRQRVGHEQDRPVEHQVFEQYGGAQFPHFAQGRVADDRAERAEQHERCDAAHSGADQKPQAVPRHVDRQREQPAHQKTSHEGREDRNDRVDSENHPR